MVPSVASLTIGKHRSINIVPRARDVDPDMGVTAESRITHADIITFITIAATPEMYILAACPAHITAGFPYLSTVQDWNRVRSMLESAQEEHRIVTHNAACRLSSRTEQYFQRSLIISTALDTEGAVEVMRYL